MFDIVFLELEVIPRTINKFVKIVAFAERYFIIAHVKNKESKKQPFQIYFCVKSAEGKMSIKN